MPICLIALSTGAIAAESTDAPARSGTVLVNGEPVTQEDIVQRVLWMNVHGHLGDRMKAVLMSDEVNQKFKERMRAADPHSQAEAQEAAQRIKAGLIAEVRKQALVEGGVTRKEAADAVIADRLKLQAAKSMGIEITDEEAAKAIEDMAKARAGGKTVDLNEQYEQLEKVGISRRTVLDITRARLAYRAVFARYYGQRDSCVFGPFKHFARSCVEKLRREATIDYL